MNISTCRQFIKSSAIELTAAIAGYVQDPKTTVLNSFNQMHEAPNVFITDGSCMASGA